MKTDLIASFSPGELSYRGVPVAQAIAELSFTDALILLITGEFGGPDTRHSEMLGVLLVAWADHGQNPPSTQAVRLAASCGVPFAQSLAAGLACWGQRHLPIEDAARQLRAIVERGEVVTMASRVIASGDVLAGFGHPVHGRNTDPRVGPVLREAVRLNLNGKHVEAARRIEGCFEAAQKDVKVNMAGITAALWLDMGLPIAAVGIIPVIGRAVGLAAHHAEVVESGQSFIGTPPK